MGGRAADKAAGLINGRRNWIGSRACARGMRLCRNGLTSARDLAPPARGSIAAAPFFPRARQLPLDRLSKGVRVVHGCVVELGGWDDACGF